ncbi:MAG TPA: hypothetical protein VHM93_24675 [Candidatus Acidoferrum sp.]|jgi:opacity protein-like surface antigen|nr:hypothetical protein [Candidatus Acidoferrum sp.]
MKSLVVSAFLLLGAVCRSQAQAITEEAVPDTDNVGPDFSATSAAKVTVPDFLAVADPFPQPRTNSAPPVSAPNLSTTLLAEPAPAKPAAPPDPRFLYGDREDYRWQLGVAFAWVRFRSSVYDIKQYDSNQFGLKVGVTYFLNEWLGVEGSFTGAFGGTATGGQNTRTGLYGGGPKAAWRQKRWEPWLHAIFGGAHQGPQTSFGGRNSFSMQIGGGADYRWNPRVSFRIEADYVRTGFFHQTQNNFQLAPGVVLHF